MHIPSACLLQCKCLHVLEWVPASLCWQIVFTANLKIGHFLIDCVAVRRRLAGCSTSSGSASGDLPAAGQTFSPLNSFFSTSTLSSRWAETPLSGWCPLSTRTPWFSFHRKKSSTRSASTTAAATGSVAKVCFSFFSFFVSTIFLWRCLSLCCWQDWCWLWCLCVRGTLYIEISRTSCLVCLPLSRNCSSLGIFALSSLEKGPREKEYFLRHCPNPPPLPLPNWGKFVHFSKTPKAST